MKTVFFSDDARVEKENEAADHWLKQLPEALQIISPALNNVCATVEVPPPQVYEVLSRNSSLISLKLESIVRISADVSFDETKPTHPSSEAPPIEEHWPSILSSHMTSSFEIACVAAHLSRPGCYIFDRPYTFFKNRAIAEANGILCLQLTDDIEDERLAWPLMQRLDLVDVVNWFKIISAFSPPIAVTRLQRTFAAFTYLIGHRSYETEGEVLFRAMQGLESFYCDGIGDLRKQMSEKTKIWLGLNQNPTNLVGKLYDLRSKYIHGSANMPYAISIDDPDHHSPSIMNEFYTGVTLATRLLVATLQKCIRDGVKDLQWEYGVRTTSE